MRMRSRIGTVHAVALLLASGAAACSSPTAAYCVSIDLLTPAVTVTVVDSVTGAPPAAPSTLTVQDGSARQVASDSLLPAGSPRILRLLSVAPGTYRFTVQAAGYHDWTVSGVVVRAGACGVVPVQFVARLVSDSL
jgi:hypothetical protein